MKKFRILSVLAMALVMVLFAQSALACTIVSVGKDATVDGSTISTHNDDSTGADFRLWIIPSMEGGEGIKRDLVVDSHNYGDFSDYPNTKDYGNGFAVTEIDQPEDTYAYFHSRYSFINEKGVAMGEATFSCDDEFYDSDTYKLLYDGNNGLIDCWNAQDIALERASTAREAVEIMGELCETCGRIPAKPSTSAMAKKSGSSRPMVWICGRPSVCPATRSSWPRTAPASPSSTSKTPRTTSALPI